MLKYINKLIIIFLIFIFSFFVIKNLNYTKNSQKEINNFIEVCRNGRINLIKNYIKKGGDINKQNKKGETALMEVADGIDKNDYKITKLLIKNGANLNLKDFRYGKTALMSAVEDNNKLVVKALLSGGAYVNLRENEFGETALMIASKNGYLELCKKLINNGADVNIEDFYGQTALLKAVSSSQLDIIKLLIDSGAEINKKSQLGATPLIVAVNNEKIKIIKYLLKEGNKIKVTKETIDIAKKKGNKKILNLLKTNK